VGLDRLGSAATHVQRFSSAGWLSRGIRQIAVISKGSLQIGSGLLLVYYCQKLPLWKLETLGFIIGPRLFIMLPLVESYFARTINNFFDTFLQWISFKPSR